MSDVSIQRLVAFNEELAALVATGLPIDIGVAGSRRDVADKLHRISSSLSLRIGRGQSFEQAIAEEPELPPRYRAALWTWMYSQDPAVALDGIASPAEARRQFGRNLGQMMVYPLIVLSLTYVAFLYLCDVTLPKIESIYAQLSREPSASVSFLMMCRERIPIWGPLVPVVVVLLIVWWRRRASGMSWNWVPGSRRYFQAVRNANLANQLATLLESGCSLDQSLQLVGPISGQPGQADDHPIDDSLPPLLRWAVRGDLGGEPLPRVLRFVAQTYRQKAERQQTIWRVAAPTLCGVLVGGMFVLGYGLGLFLPVVQLLKDVSLPGGA